MQTHLSTRLTPDFGMAATDDFALERNFALERVGISSHATSVRESANSNRRSAFSAFAGDGLKVERARVFEVGDKSDAMRRRIGVHGSGWRRIRVGLGCVWSGLLLREAISICGSATAEHLGEGDVPRLISGWHGGRLRCWLETRCGAPAVAGCRRAWWRHSNCVWVVCEVRRGQWEGRVWWRSVCSRGDL